MRRIEYSEILSISELIYLHSRIRMASSQSRGFDGHDAQHFFVSHPLLPASVIVAYLFTVWQLPKWMAQRPAFQLRAVSRCWNLSVAGFSIW